MLIASIVMWAMVLVVYGWVILRRRDQLPRLFKVFCRQGEVFVALVPAALIAAGFLTPLVPGELVAQWLGGAAGFRGLVIGMLAGYCIPLPPLIFFSVIAVLVLILAPLVYAALPNEAVAPGQLSIPAMIEFRGLVSRG